jgi:hypothetical protein
MWPREGEEGLTSLVSGSLVHVLCIDSKVEAAVWVWALDNALLVETPEDLLL